MPFGPPSEEEHHHLEVKVVDAIGRPVVKAFVSVLEYSPKTKRLMDVFHDFTDDAGQCCTREPASGGHSQQYILTISKYGFKSAVSLRNWFSPANSEVQLGRRLDASERNGIAITEGSREKVLTGEAGRTIEAIPIAGMRSFDSLALLAAGVAPAPETLDAVGPNFAPGIGTSGSFAVNGVRPRENNFTLDDGDDNDELVGIRRQGFVVPASIAVEAIQDFQIVSSLPDARYARSAAGQVNVVTKASLGGFHGTAYGFFTDQALSARNYFDGSTLSLPAEYPVTTERGSPVLLDGGPLEVSNPSSSIAPFSRLQTGATVGFNLHENFIFLAGERDVQKGREDAHFSVPTVDQRGMFDSGSTGLIVNGVPSFPDTPVGDAIFSLYPFPNDPKGPYGPNTYSSQLPAEGNGLQTSMRIDRQLAQSLRVGFRGNFTREKSVHSVTGGAISSAITPTIKNFGFTARLEIAGRTAHSFLLSLNGTRASLDPYPVGALTQDANLLLNATRPGAGSADVQYVSGSSQAGGQILESLGYGGITTTEPITGEVGQLEINGFSPVGLDPFSYPQKRVNSTTQISYSVASSKFSFGAEWRQRRVNTQVVQNSRPLIRFAGLGNSPSSNGLDLSTPTGTPDLTSLSGATLAAIGVPSAVAQTLLDLRPQSAAAPQGSVPTQALNLTEGSFYLLHARQLRPGFRITASLRLDLANASEVLDVKNRTFSALYNYSLLLADAQEAETTCGVRCQGLSSAVTRAFTPNSFALPGKTLSLGPRLKSQWVRLPGKIWSVKGGVGVYSSDLQFFAVNDSRQGFNTSVPLNLTNFPITSAQGTYLFNLANNRVRQLSPGLNVFPSTIGTLNGLTVNPFVFMTQDLYQLSGIGLQPTLPSVLLIDSTRRLRNPYSIQYSVGTELEKYGFNFVLSYVGTRGVKLVRLDTPNGGPNRGSVRLDGIAVSDSGIPAVQGQLLPPGLQGLLGGSFTLAPTVYESIANSLYNSVQFEVRRRYSHGFQFSSALTYSRAYDDASDVTEVIGAVPIPQDSQKPSEWGRSSFDVPLRFVSSFVWDVAPRERRPLLRGWQVSGVSVVQSGQPFTVNSTFDVNGDGNLTDRLNTSSGIVRGSGGVSVLQLTAEKSDGSLLAPNGQAGAVGRNTFRAPGMANLDLALSRTIELGETRQITVRGEAFNVLNTPQFGIPQRLLEAPAFGQEVRTLAPARLLQVALKFSF